MFHNRNFCQLNKVNFNYCFLMQNIAPRRARAWWRINSNDNNSNLVMSGLHWRYLMIIYGVQIHSNTIWAIRVQVSSKSAILILVPT